MIGSLIGEVLLREVPPALVAGVQSGQYQVFGSIIRSATTGRIVGHLQEAGGLAKLVGSVGAGPLAPLSLLAEGAEIVQNEQIKAGVRSLQAGMATLQCLGVANLALGAAGIGVSIAGFAVLSRKIDAVKTEVSGLGAQIEALGRQVAMAEQLRHVAALGALAESLDESWALSPSAAERRWQHDARDGMNLVKIFEEKAAQILATQPEAALLAAPVLDGFSLASAVRIAALAAAGEMPAAYQAAEKDARTLNALTGDIGLADLARARMGREGVTRGTPEWSLALDRAVEDSRADVTRLRHREAAAATRAAPLMALESRNVRARDWLAAARSEGEAPILVLLDGELIGGSPRPSDSHLATRRRPARWWKNRWR